MEKETALRHYVGKKGYAFIHGKLEEVKLIRTTYELYEDEHAYADETIVLRPNGETYKVGQMQFEQLYASPEDYEKHVPLSQHAFDMNDAYVVGRLFGNHRHSDKDYYVFTDGKAHKKTISLYYLAFDYEANELVLDGKSRIPEDVETYRSSQEAYDFNIYKVVDETGKETERIGCNRLLFLDDDQKELIQEFNALIKKIKDNGIFLVMDCCDDLRAFNVRNVADYEMAYDENELPDDGRKWEECLRYAEPNQVDASIADWSEDHTIYITRDKKSE